MSAGRRLPRLVWTVIAMSCVPSYAAFPDGFTHSDLEWHELLTPHFRVIYHTGLENTARTVAIIAEGNYERVCASIGARPTQRTPVILGEFTTQTREFATQLKHTIWLVGNTVNDARIDQATWLELVVHEFAHVCTYYRLRGGPVPSLWEWATAPLVPGWLYEGIANREASRYGEAGYAALRSAVLEGKLPPLAAMDTQADRTITDLWLKYAGGHSMVEFMVKRGGPDVMSRVLEAHADFPFFDRAVRKVFGMSYADLFREWKAYVSAYYEPLRAVSRPVEEYSSSVDLGVEMVRSARVSADGSKIAFTAIENTQEQFLQLFVANRDGSDRRLISSDVDFYKSVAFSWSPDGSKLAYARHWTRPNGTVRFGIYVRDLDAGTDRRITGDANALDPQWSPDGNWIACVLFDGFGEASRLALIRPDGSEVRVLTEGEGMPTSVFRPTWAPGSDELCFEVVHNGAVNLATISVAPAAPRIRMLTDDQYGQNRSPSWSPDGGRIAFYGYRHVVTGEANGEPVVHYLPQVYVYHLADETLQQVTCDTGRTPLDPTWTPDGQQLLVTMAGAEGAQLRIIDAAHSFRAESLARPPADGYEPWYRKGPGLRERYPDVDDSAWRTRPYDSWDSIGIYLLRPNIITDIYGYQPALRVFAQDPLEQHELAAEVSYSRQFGMPNWAFEYTNSSRRSAIEVRAYQRLRGPTPLGLGQSVIDTERFYSLGTRYMRNPWESPLRRDQWTFGLNRREFRVLSASGGATAPLQVTTCLEGVYESSVVRPAKSRTTLQLIARASIPALSRNSRLYDIVANYDREWVYSGTRRSLKAGVEGRGLAFADRMGSGLRGWYLLPRLSYTWRIDDYAWSSAWPVVWADRLDARLSYEHYHTRGDSLLNRYPGHLLRAELVAQGHITRAVPYTVSVGAEFRPGAPPGAALRYFATFTTDAPRVFGF